MSTEIDLKGLTFENVVIELRESGVSYRGRLARTTCRVIASCMRGIEYQLCRSIEPSGVRV